VPRYFLGSATTRSISMRAPGDESWFTQIVVEAAGVVLFGFIAFAAALTISRNMDNRTATLEMPFLVFMAPLALGAFLLALETAIVLARIIRAGHADAKRTTLT
jgi:TRAP-type C4-dicarboxylate transport system permease small subunit